MENHPWIFVTFGVSITIWILEICCFPGMSILGWPGFEPGIFATSRRRHNRARLPALDIFYFDIDVYLFLKKGGSGRNYSFFGVLTTYHLFLQSLPCGLFLSFALLPNPQAAHTPFLWLKLFDPHRLHGTWVLVFPLFPLAAVPAILSYLIRLSALKRLLS